MLPLTILKDSPAGDTRPVCVFVHGFMGSPSDWREIADRLDRASAAVTLPGHGTGVSPEASIGYSQTIESLAASIARLASGPVDLIGYSMGGRLAAVFADRHPERVNRLIVESAHPGLESSQDRERRLVEDLERAGLLAEDFDQFLHDWFEQPVFRSIQYHSGIKERLLVARRGFDPTGLAAALVGLSLSHQPALSWGFPSSHDVPGHQQDPVLSPSRISYICGDLDSKYAAIGRRLAVKSDPIQVFTVNDAGHNVHLEKPDAYLAVLTSILETHSQ